MSDTNLKNPVIHGVVHDAGLEKIVMERRLVNLRVEFMGDHALAFFLNPSTNKDYADMPPFRIDSQRTMLMQFALPLRPTQ